MKPFERVSSIQITSMACESASSPAAGSQKVTLSSCLGILIHFHFFQCIFWHFWQKVQWLESAQVRDAGNLLTRAGFSLPTVDVDEYTVRYPSGMSQLVTTCWKNVMVTWFAYSDCNTVSCLGISHDLSALFSGQEKNVFRLVRSAVLSRFI